MNVLILGPQTSGKLRVCEAVGANIGQAQNLGGPNSSHSGVILRTTLQNKYFSAKVTLMVEEFPEQRDLGDDKVDALKLWAREFVLEEVAELRAALAGIVVTIGEESGRYVDRCLDVVDSIRDSLDGFIVVVGASDVEDEVISHGYEYVNVAATGTNEFGEKCGYARLVEILETEVAETEDNNDSDGYIGRKLERVEDMSTGLLSDEHVDLQQLVERLKAEKEAVGKMKVGEREEYVKRVVEEMADFL